MNRTFAVLTLAAALAACGDAPADRAGRETAPDTAGEPVAQPEPAAQTSPDSLMVVFTREEQPVRMKRPVASGGGTVEEALTALLRGPTAEERETGIHSWFSATTSSALKSVTVDSAGKAVVNFADLRELIPNAASSAGSAMLLHELNGTIFQFSEVQAVEYRIEGSCAAFWEWLQYDCQVVRRAGR